MISISEIIGIGFPDSGWREKALWGLDGMWVFYLGGGGGREFSGSRKREHIIGDEGLS